MDTFSSAIAFVELEAFLFFQGGNFPNRKLGDLDVVSLCVHRCCLQGLGKLALDYFWENMRVAPETS
jgi:hypothetical protein